jgi:hypothetical protein
MTKYGLLGYEIEFKNAANVGDYVQSFAALGFLGGDLQDVNLVNREELSTWSGEPTILIMNGWFMHRPESWPPSEKIDPIFASFHINPTVYDYFGRRESLQYLKAHEPIGCRDHETRRFLESHGVDAHFSGCLTLTLNRDLFCTSDENLGVLFCDVVHGKGSISALFKRIDLTLPGKIARLPRVIWEKVFVANGDKIVRKLKMALGDMPVTTVTTQIPVDLNERERFEFARQNLDIYARSSLVVTSRIHAALPCLAFGTPVLFVNPDIDSSRFDGIADLFTTISIEELESISVGKLSELLKSIENPDSCIEYREALKKMVTEALSKRASNLE